MRRLGFIGSLWLAVALAVQTAATGLKSVNAEAGKGFNQDYLMFVPEQLRTNCVIVVATPTPTTSEDATEFKRAADLLVKKAGPLIGKLGLPLIVPVLPRPPLQVSEGSFIDVYYPALSRAALETKDQKLARIDRQVLAMVDDACSDLRQRGVFASDKVIFVGFSAAGHFATRMALLHPQRVLAIWAGGMGGHAIVPVEQLGGRPLTYPVGIADLKEVTDADFDAAAMRGISAMFVQGARDTNTSLPSDMKPSDSYTFEQAELIRDLFGTNSVERLEKVAKLWQDAGAKTEVKIYPEAGHQMTPDALRDMIGFIERCLPQETAK